LIKVRQIDPEKNAKSLLCEKILDISTSVPSSTSSGGEPEAVEGFVVDGGWWVTRITWSV
jgi:hypothetical protein